MESASVRNLHTPLSFFGLACIGGNISGLKIIDDPILDGADLVSVSPKRQICHIEVHVVNWCDVSANNRAIGVNPRKILESHRGVFEVDWT